MMKKNHLALFLLSLVVLFFNVFPTEVGAVSCDSTNIRWAQSSNSVYVSGDVDCSLTEIKQFGSQSIPLILVDEASKIWFLGAKLILQDGAKLVLYGDSAGGDVNELRLKSNNDVSNNFVFIKADYGDIDIDGVKVISWDESLSGPDTEYTAYKRAYIQVRSHLDSDGVTPLESRMDIRNSEIAYLGYNGSETYGLSWKVLGDAFDTVGVFGDVDNNAIHHNYFGIYTYGAEAMTFTNNESYNNVVYGIDPHDDSDFLLIDNNYIHNNGSHGIICSKRCNDLEITNNTSSNNGGNGIMLHRYANDSLIEGNIVHNNGDTGIAIFDSHNNTIINNDSKYNNNGIRFSVGSSGNTVENNELSENNKYGMYFYKGTDVPTSGDGRIKNNTFKNNTINANVSVATKIQQSDENVFENNVFTGNNSYVAELNDSKDNVFEGNTLAGNAKNYFYAKLNSVNEIKNSDSFAVKIGDTLSSMTVNNEDNAVFKNSKNILTTVYPEHSEIILNQSNIKSSIVTFDKLSFAVIPSSESLDIKPITWNTSGDFYKKWTAKNNSSDSISVSHTVGDLATSTSYDVKVGGVLWNSFVSNDEGKIMFDYLGSFLNTKTFEIQAS